MQQTIFITGATDGLGLAMARIFMRAGYLVYGLGRRPFSQLTNTPFTPQTYCQADLLVPNFADKVKAFFVDNQIDQLDLLIHNAGTGYYGRLHRQPPLSIDTIVQVNLKAPIQLTYALLPRLQKANGHITFVSSVATHMPTPDYAVYTATKKALEAFARNLGIEQKGKVSVQVLQPGATRTGMHDKLDIPKSKLNQDGFPSAEKVARQMVTAIERKRPFVTIGFSNRLLRLAGRTAPRLLDRQLARDKSPLEKSGQSPPRCLITGAADGIVRR